MIEATLKDMKQADQIEIPSNKKLTFWLFLTFAAFAGLCIILCIAIAKNPLEFTNPSRFGNPIVAFVILIPGAILCVGVAVMMLRSFLDKRAGLIINKEGITENSMGIIPWSDIKDIKSVKMDGHKFLPIIVKNPQDYIDRATDRFERKGLKNYYETYGSPIVISDSLQIKFDDLHRLLLEKMREYKQ